MRRLVAVVAAFTLALAACGGSGEAADTTVAEAADTTVAEAADTTVAEADGGSETTGATPYYEGKSVTIVNSHPPGGGTSLAAEFYATTFELCLPGVESVEVDYSLTGSSGDIAVVEFQQRQPRDGTVLQHIGSSYAALHVLDNPDIAGTLEGTRGLAVAPTSAVTYARAGLGFDDPLSFIEWVEDGGKVVPVTSSFSGGRLPIFMSWMMFGIAEEIGPNVILGYDGDSGARLAFEQKEGNLTMETSASFVENALARWGPEEGDGTIVPLWQAGLGMGGEMVRAPRVPDIPHVGDVYEQLTGETPSGEDWTNYVDWMNAAGALYLFTHDDIPEEAYQALAGAFDTCTENPEWQAALEEWSGSSVGNAPLLWGADAAASTSKWTELGDEFRDWFFDMVETYYPYGPERP